MGRTKFLTFGMSVWLTSCVNQGLSPEELREIQAHPCRAWTTWLGPDHNCTNREGGSLNEDLVRREITQEVVLRREFLYDGEIGLAALVFNTDGTYQARKLYFTSFSAQKNSLGHGINLVYAEDSKGVYDVAPDGAITLERPEFSTCPTRTKSDAEMIRPHTQIHNREQPYRVLASKKVEIAFGIKNWVKDFLGDDHWFGTVVSRQDFRMPPFAKADQNFLPYRFEGFDADIFYGCIDGGYASFSGPERPRTRIKPAVSSVP